MFKYAQKYNWSNSSNLFRYSGFHYRHKVFVPVLKNTGREIFRDFIESNNAHEITEDEIHYVTIHRSGNKSSGLTSFIPAMVMDAPMAHNTDEEMT